MFRLPCLAAVAALLVVSVAAPAPAHAQFYEDLARTNALTAADDYRIGKQYIDTMSWLWGIVDDPDLQAKVEAQVRAIVHVSERPDLPINVVLLDTQEVKAAALPGGFLLINKGLLDKMSEEEVGFVLAHELAHVHLRHFATTMNLTRAQSAMTLAADSQSMNNRDEGIKAAEELARMARAYSRDLEREADLYGMLYALRAGYRAEVGVEAMGRMRDLVGEMPKWEEDMASHPTFADRIDQLKKGIATVEETYALFEAGVAYSRSGAPDAAISAFQAFLTLFPKSSSAWSNRRP